MTTMQAETSSEKAVTLVLKQQSQLQKLTKRHTGHDKANEKWAKQLAKDLASAVD